MGVAISNTVAICLIVAGIAAFAIWKGRALLLRMTPWSFQLWVQDKHQTDQHQPAIPLQDDGRDK